MEEHSQQRNTDATSEAIATPDDIAGSYVSAELLLQTEIDEYHVEDMKRQNLNMRIGFFIPLTSAILIFIATSVMENNIDVMKPISWLTCAIYWIYGGLTTVAVFFTVLALHKFIQVCLPANYRRIIFDELLNSTTKPVTLFAMSLCVFYRDAVRHNRSVNQRKTTLFQDGIIHLQRAILFMGLSLFILLVIKLYERGAILNG